MDPFRIGLISDTHGVLRPQALHALRDVRHIIHAGDVGTPEILQQLAQIAPVTAVRGNNDQAAWASVLPVSITLVISDVTFHVLHDLKELDLEPPAMGFQVVISGHSHKPSINTKEGVLYVNPGSAGPRRFKLPVSVALLEMSGGCPRAWIEMLDLPG
ncbi:MAG: metallophosphoesterase family protein [Pseudomonadota bacterium]